MAHDDPAAVIIPYRNVPALVGYYFGVFSIIPCVGFILALVALPLGIVGLRKARREPGAHGTAHAWTAIVLGSLVILLHLGGFALMFLAG